MEGYLWTRRLPTDPPPHLKLPNGSMLETPLHRDGIFFFSGTYANRLALSRFFIVEL